MTTNPFLAAIVVSIGYAFAIYFYQWVTNKNWVLATEISVSVSVACLYTAAVIYLGEIL